jgi:hypothetical protein
MGRRFGVNSAPAEPTEYHRGIGQMFLIEPDPHTVGNNQCLARPPYRRQ